MPNPRSQAIALSFGKGEAIDSRCHRPSWNSECESNRFETKRNKWLEFCNRIFDLIFKPLEWVDRVLRFIKRQLNACSWVWRLALRVDGLAVNVMDDLLTHVLDTSLSLCRCQLN